VYFLYEDQSLNNVQDNVFLIWEWNKPHE
jgi:hypothetical protein